MKAQRMEDHRCNGGPFEFYLDIFWVVCIFVLKMNENGKGQQQESNVVNGCYWNFRLHV